MSAPVGLGIADDSAITFRIDVTQRSLLEMMARSGRKSSSPSHPSRAPSDTRTHPANPLGPADEFDAFGSEFVDALVFPPPLVLYLSVLSPRLVARSELLPTLG